MPAEISNILLDHPDLAGIHFTGSTGVFNSMWQRVGQNLGNYRSYPRIVGETGGKDFIVAHPSADPQAVAVGARPRRVRVSGAEVLGGQPRSTSRSRCGPTFATAWSAMMQEIKHGRRPRLPQLHGRGDRQEGVHEDQRLHRRREAERHDRRRAAAADGDEGYFIEPTLVETADPGYRLLCEEIFGPVLTAYVVRRCEVAGDAGDRRPDVAVRADRRGVRARSRGRREASTALRNAAGNFYINDKPTGAVVGQQPFGGARASGTNDKAGSKLNLMRWVSPRTIKETFAPPTDYRYPFMSEE